MKMGWQVECITERVRYLKWQTECELMMYVPPSIMEVKLNVYTPWFRLPWRSTFNTIYSRLPMPFNLFQITYLLFWLRNKHNNPHLKELSITLQFRVRTTNHSFHGFIPLIPFLFPYHYCKPTSHVMSECSFRAIYGVPILPTSTSHTYGTYSIHTYRSLYHHFLSKFYNSSIHLNHI